MHKGKVNLKDKMTFSKIDSTSDTKNNMWQSIWHMGQKPMTHDNAKIFECTPRGQTNFFGGLIAL